MELMTIATIAAFAPLAGAVTRKRNVAWPPVAATELDCTSSPKLSRRPATGVSTAPSLAATPAAARAWAVRTVSVYSADCPAPRLVGPVIATWGAAPPEWHLLQLSPEGAVALGLPV